MQDDSSARTAALARLEPLVGEWAIETTLAAPGTVHARSVFEWALGGQFLLQRSTIDLPEAPDSLCVVAFEPGTGEFTQHYFDSRGVVRIYAMTFSDGRWTLRRETADFTPLPFSQRFTAELEDDGSAIRGRWERTEPGGSEYALDFELTYVRL